MFKIASWNVNSLNVRLPQVLDWLTHQQPDVLALQETKLTDDKFPKADIEALGYHVHFIGQKTYNGVAILSKHKIEEPLTSLGHLDDDEKRYLFATINGIRVVNLYVPNGQSIDSDKYHYKLNWLAAITHQLQEEIKAYPKLIVLGDFNIAPHDRDVHDPIAWEGHVLTSAAEREAYERLLRIGMKDSYRLLYPEETAYTWWDYRQAAFRRNRGLRIDHILISDALCAHCTNVEIDKSPRKNERPSDHTPIIATFDL